MVKNCLQKGSLNYKEIEEVSSMLKVMSAENRLKIVCLLEKEEKCVCEINEDLDLAQNLVSHHLKILKDEDIIKARKEGLNVFYKLNQKRLKEIKKIINKYL